MTVRTGTVKWYSYTKGVGFITPDDGSNDLFAHFTEIRGAASHKTLRGAQRVNFEVGKGRKGSQAMNIRAA